MIKIPLFKFSKRKTALSYAKKQRKAGKRAAVGTTKYKGNWIVEVGKLPAALRNLIRKK